MPTKAGRVRIEDLRVGRVIWDIAIDWGERGCYARPLVIVSVERRHFGHNTDIHFSTREPLEQIQHFFHARSKLTRCGFWGSPDAQWSDQEVVDWGLDPINFFVNRKAAERYLTRLRQQAEFRRPSFIPQRESIPHIPKGTGQRDWLKLPKDRPLSAIEQKAADSLVEQLHEMTYKLYKDSGYRSVGEVMAEKATVTYDPTDVQPKTPQDIVEDFHNCFRADLDTRPEPLITSIRTGLIASAGESITQEQLMGAIDAYIEKVKDAPLADFKIDNVKAQPDGSVEFSISGPPDMIQALQEGREQADTGALAQANAMFVRSSESLRLSRPGELRGLKITPLPADPKDLAQGYSWPIRVEVLDQPDRDYSNIWGEPHVESPNSALTAFSTSRLIEGIQPAAEAAGSTSGESDEVGVRPVVDGEADSNGTV